VQRLKKADIKVTVTVDYMAASCGYMLSASADHIIVSPSAMVGNIGSVMPMPKPKKPIEMIGTTRAKELMAGATAKSAKDKAILERQAKLMVVPFYKAVFANRKIKPQDIPMVFSAHLFPATMAKDLGLVDELLDKRSVKLRYFMTGYTMVEVNHVSPMTLASALK
jgi:serine protease SohB